MQPLRRGKLSQTESGVELGALWSLSTCQHDIEGEAAVDTGGEGRVDQKAKSRTGLRPGGRKSLNEEIR